MRPINLLPPKARERAAARRKQSLWIALGLVYLAILVLATLWWQGQVDEAAEEAAAQQAVVEGLRAEVAQLQDLSNLRTEFEETATVVSEILATDVAWGRLLNDFGRLIPPRVWMTQFSGSSSADSSSSAVGLLALIGTAFDYPDVASWLRSLDSANFPGVDQTWVSSATTGQIGEIPVVDFSSSTELTADALSDRAATRIPDVP